VFLVIPTLADLRSLPFSAAHFPGRFRLIPAPAASRLLLSRFRPYTIGFPPIKQPLALEAEALAFGCPKKMEQEKGENSVMSYLYVKSRLSKLGFGILKQKKAEHREHPLTGWKTGWKLPLNFEY
jgi:hypothetical protein